MTIDPQELAQQELAKVMIPTPDDVCESLSPVAALYYWERLGWQVYTLWVAYASDEAEKDPTVGDDLAETLQGIGTTLGAMDAVCARIGLIPQEALDGATQ